MRILHVVGARPNFMKAAPVIQALASRSGIHQILVHTGQHYDVNMSDIFFQQLGIPVPDINLGVGPGTHAQQTAGIMNRFEPVIRDCAADLILVYGDVNSTIAAALVGTKLLIPIGHVEAGLRSFDRTMPEEINRILTDQIADLLFTPSSDGDENLLREGIASEKIHCVGNVMIDTLVRLLPMAHYTGTVSAARYVLVTLHRPSNVDDLGMLQRLIDTLAVISHELPVIFPVHPRTRQRISQLGQPWTAPDLHLVDPLGYLDFLALQLRATVVVTDSGGIQEETTYLGVPCLTVRENTERPITVSMGTNILIGRDLEKLQTEIRRVVMGQGKRGQIPPLWDGRAAERIAGVIVNGR